MNKENKCKKNKIVKCLNKYYNDNTDIFEIGIDEAGRGPMFGRVYASAVILPKDDTFKHHLMKDSKKFSSSKKIKEVSEYIKNNSIKWAIGYSTEDEIDKINIRNATHIAMHRAISKIIDNKECDKYFLLVDGRDFKPYININTETEIASQIGNICIEGGDNKYSNIAAASILAKVARDEYIEDLCKNDEKLDIRYGLLKNKGYGTSQHMNGINTYGITKHHRKTFGICANYI